MRVTSIATPAGMPQARVLGRALARQHPEWSFEVMLIAGDAVVDAVREEGSVRVRSLAGELGLDVETLLVCHPEPQLSTLLVPKLLELYLREDATPVLHLPGSACLLGRLDPFEQALGRRSVLLAARMSADVPDDGLEPSPAQMRRAGRVEHAIMAVDGTPAGAGFLRWWAQHTQEALGSLDARRGGARPEDRPWLARLLELAPARFDAALIQEPGCNLNMWNIHSHELGGTADRPRLDERWPLRLLNLPGFDPGRPHRLGAMASRARVSRSPILRELCGRYAQELQAAGWHDPGHRADVGRRLADGLVYDDALRLMHGVALALGEPFEDPFSPEGTAAFLAWLKAPAVVGGGHGINRYVLQRVARERPDVMRTYGDLDGAGGEEYVAWCWAFGRHELAIPERFMPPRPGSAPGERAAQAQAPPPASPGVPVPAVAREDGLAVRLTGYLGHTLGLGAAARGYAAALGAAGVPVRTVTVPLHHLELPVELEAQYGKHEFEELVHGGRHGFELVAVNADELPDFVGRLGEDYFEGPRIAIWGWETNTIPARWQRVYPLVDEIWVYSQFMADNIGAAAPVPVVALPPPVEPPGQPATPSRLGVPDGFLFLFIFDYLSTVQRKNPVGLVEAFKRAFAPQDGAQLLIKTINAPLRPLAEEEVLWAAHGRPDVHVVDRSLSGGELAGVIAACDCYVSLHRAEGFGLTIAEAMAIGKPVIATGYSGNVDFMSKENSYLVDWTMGRVGPDCEIYPPEGEWAEPSIEHAAQLMRRVREQPAEAAAKGRQARADVTSTLSAAVTGQRMRARLEHLSRRPTRRPRPGFSPR